MERNKGITTAKSHLINLMTPIYSTNHQKRQLVNFLKKYACIIYVKSCLASCTGIKPKVSVP